MEMTPNVKRLFIHRVSTLAVPPGGGLGDGMAFFMDGAKRRQVMLDAEAWVVQALAAVRSASDPNPYRGATDETIAGEILRKIETRQP